MLVARRLTYVALCGAVAAACDSATEPKGASRFAPLSADSLFIGRTLGVVTLSTLDGSVITAAPQLWSSSDTNVAVVSAGRVFALGAGTAQITAKLAGHDNTVNVRVVPLWLDGGVEFARTSTGYWANCAITETGGVACRSPSAPDSLRGFTEVATGGPPLDELHIAEPHQCGLTSGGAMFCRGWNTRGQFGNGETSITRAAGFVAAAGEEARFSALSTGGSGMIGHTCGIRRTDSVLFCFGANDVGQAGQDAAQTQDSVPMAVAGNFRALHVAAGRRSTCAVALDGQAHCWGLNILGVLGRPRAEVNFTGTPQLVEGGFTFTQLSADGHTCGVTPAKELYCWGSNAGGQLGIGTRDNAEHATPTRVPLESPIALVATANGFTCAITDDGALYCWGLYPQSAAMVERLGDSRYSPVHVARGLRFRSVSTSPQNVCAVTTDDRLMCF